jgi:hypothetical protein
VARFWFLGPNQPPTRALPNHTPPTASNPAYPTPTGCLYPTNSPPAVRSPKPSSGSSVFGFWPQPVSPRASPNHTPHCLKPSVPHPNRMPSTRKTAPLRLVHQNRAPAARFLVLAPASAPSRLTQSHSPTASNPVYPTPTGSPLCKKQPHRISFSETEPWQLGFHFLAQPSHPSCATQSRTPTTSNPIYLTQSQ